MRIFLTALVCIVLSISLNSQDQTHKTKPTQEQVNSDKLQKFLADGVTPPSNLIPKSSSIPGSDGMQRCMTDEYAAIRRVTHPKEKQIIRAIMESAQSKVESFIGCDGTNSIVIPVAVHFDASFDCSNTQCLIDAALGNIASMNADFAALNADISYYDDYTTACAASFPAADVSDGTCMTFCLATQNHPAGENLVDGQPAITIGKYGWTGGADAPAFAGYFNIFVASNSGGLGIAAAPGLANGDGVQVDAVTFGGPLLSCSSGAPLNTNTTYNLGRTLTHEAGHYFDLFHTFQGGCADGDTGTFSGQVGVINDTPAASAPFFGCPASPATCADIEASGCASMYQQITNYMDYTDDACMVMFTMDQAAVMNGWANSLAFVDNATACGTLTNNTLAACAIGAAFSPADGSNIVICTDDGNTIALTDLTTNSPISWTWTFAVASGDLTIGSTSSTTQNPSITVTGGAAGTIDVTLVACDASGDCSTLTQTYNVTLVSGAACPTGCDFTLNLTDDFGDGWNGATVEIFENGVSVGVFGGGFVAGATDGPYTITLEDGATIDVVQTNGGFAGEEGFTLVGPFGFDVAVLVDGAPISQTFTASCSPATCTDGVQNGDETGIDCGGASCPSCCGNGIQDADETDVDCGGADCVPCPACMTGLDEIMNETFDACMMPAGWTVSGPGVITFDGGPTDVPGGQTPSEDFSVCIAIIDDDAANAVGISCIISPIIDMSSITNAELTFDWQNNDFAGDGDFYVEVYDGAAWVQVFIEMEDAFGTDQTVSLAAYTNADFQIRFCYDDEGADAWGAGFDNVSICGEQGVAMCPAAIIPDDISGSYCDGSAATVSASPTSNVTFAWTSSNPNIVIVDPAAASSSVELSALTPCQIEMADISLVATCDLDGVELFNGIVSTVSVYPAPPADVTTLVVLNENTCDEPVLVDPNCTAFVTLTPDAGNPTFPVVAGESGTASYTITYASPAEAPECCVVPMSGELIIGGAGAVGNDDGDLEIIGTGGVSGWTSTSTNFGSVMCDTGSCGTGGGSVNYGVAPNSNAWLAWFGGIGVTETGTLETDVVISACANGAATMTFGYENSSCGDAADFIELQIDGAVVWSDNADPATCGTMGVVELITVDLSAFADGASHNILFTSTSGAGGVASNFTVDNVILETTGCDAGGSLCEGTVSGSYDCVAIPDASIPTMGEWGLMILGLLIMITSIVAIRQKENDIVVS